MVDEGYRPLSDAEREVILKLLSLPFEGREEALAQLETCRARPWPSYPGHCPSIEFQVDERLRLIPHSRPYDTPMPLELGGVNPADGTIIDVILFHKNGRLKELEFVVYGDVALLEIPPLGDMELHDLRDIRLEKPD